MKTKKKITLHRLNLSNFNLNKKYSLIILPWRSFQYITDDVDAKSCLEQTIKHMNEDSIFIISIFNPQKNYTNDWVGKKYISYEYFDKNKNIKVIRSTKNISVDPIRQIITYDSNFQINNQNEINMLTDTISQKYYYNDQIKKLLNSVGLKIENEYGYYDKSDITDLSEQIFVCKLK